MTVDTTIPAPKPADTRELRALALWRNRRAEIVEISPDVYRVPSCAGTGSYRVEYATETCSCPDARRLRSGDLNCKHVLCVGIVRAKERRIPLPAHELIRRDAAAHPERGYSEHVEASRRIAGRQYREDLEHISAAAWAEFGRQLEAEDFGL